MFDDNREASWSDWGLFNQSMKGQVKERERISVSSSRYVSQIYRLSVHNMYTVMYS